MCDDLCLLINIHSHIQALCRQSKTCLKSSKPAHYGILMRCKKSIVLDTFLLIVTECSTKAT